MKEKRKKRKPLNANPIPCPCGGIFKVYCTVRLWSYVKCSTCSQTKKVLRPTNI